MGDLKKQSQFTPVQISVRFCLKGIYDDMPSCVLRKNKANLKPILPLAPPKVAGEK